MESGPLLRNRCATLATFAAALGAMICTAAPAEAATVEVPGLGGIEVPDSIPLPPGAPRFETPVQSLPFAPSVGERAVDAARGRLGAPYVSGGSGPWGFDCSGLVQWAYRQAGVEVPRTSYAQLAAGIPVPLNQIQVGDVVSYSGGGHSAIYLGDGMIIHAATSTVEISSLYYSSIVGVRRF